MGIEKLLVIGWLADGKPQLRVGCPDHKADALTVVSDRGLLLLCSEGDCVLGRWDNETSMNEELAAYAKRIKAAYLKPPRKKA